MTICKVSFDMDLCWDVERHTKLFLIGAVISQEVKL